MALPGTEVWKSIVNDAVTDCKQRGLADVEAVRKHLEWDFRGAASRQNMPAFVNDVLVGLGMATASAVDEPKVRAFLEEFFKAKGLPVPAKMKINIGGGRSVVRVTLGDLGCKVMQKETAKLIIDADPSGQMTIGFQPNGATYVLKEGKEADESVASYTFAL